MSYTAFFDGSAEPNPGERSIGGLVYDTHGNLLYSFSDKIGYGTNNEAEYEALIKVCTFIRNHGVWDVDIKGDSLLVINQVTNKWKCKTPRLIPLKRKVQEMLTSDVKFTLNHVPREQNTLADRLSKGK